MEWGRVWRGGGCRREEDVEGGGCGVREGVEGDQLQLYCTCMPVEGFLYLRCVFSLFFLSLLPPSLLSQLPGAVLLQWLTLRHSVTTTHPPLPPSSHTHSHTSHQVKHTSSESTAGTQSG